MNVLALSTDADCLGHVARIFADQVTDITPLRDASRFFESARSGKWSTFLVDYDLLKSNFPNPLDLIPQLPTGSQFVFVGAHSFAEWHDRLRIAGAIVLHKPNTVGELGVALRKVAADMQRPR